MFFLSPSGRRGRERASSTQKEARYGDDLIASILNKLGHRTGTDLRWTRQRVASTRHNYGIAGRTRTVPDPEILSLARAAKYCEIGKHVIERLTMKGFLNNEQTVPMAPWEIRRSDRALMMRADSKDPGSRPAESWRLKW